tara:strand:+ start:154 stop:285 length:132 start_codon:yes stop_codon:yes gene_type:complete
MFQALNPYIPEKIIFRVTKNSYLNEVILIILGLFLSNKEIKNA